MAIRFNMQETIIVYNKYIPNVKLLCNSIQKLASL